MVYIFDEGIHNIFFSFLLTIKTHGEGETEKQDFSYLAFSSRIR